MKKKILTALTILLALRMQAAEPLPQRVSRTPPTEEQKLSREEKRELVEESQEQSGRGSQPNLPKEPSIFKRNMVMLIVTLVTAVAGIGVVGSNPGRGAP